MGDRANVKVVDDVGGAVYLYTHWGGYDLPMDVHAALSRRWRWDDPSYLARIVFQQMLGDAGIEETGFGIGASMPDNEHAIIVLEKGSIRLESESGRPLWPSKVQRISMAFGAFVEDPSLLYAAYEKARYQDYADRSSSKK